MQQPSAEYIRQTDEKCRSLFSRGRLYDLWDMLCRTRDAFSDRDCIIEKSQKVWVSHTVRDLYADTHALGNALAHDFPRGTHIAILGENSYDWIVSFFAVACSGNVAVPLDKELNVPEVTALCRKADCALILCSAAYLKTAQQTGLPLVVFSHDAGNDTIADWIEHGRALPDADAFHPLPDDAAAIIFTSGTTGANKGVVLTHKNLTANVEGVVRTNDPVYSVLSVLPINHAYELGSSILPHIYTGCVIYINDRLRNFFRNVCECQPEFMAVVPLFAENIRRMILNDAETHGRLDDLRCRVDESRTLLRRGIDRRAELFAQERALFGYRFPYLACGGAPLKPETASFLDALGFPLLLGYGLTETSPIVTLNQNAGKYPASVGKPFPFTEVRIHAPDAEGVGEVYVRGDNVSPGYYNDPDADRKSFSDGWFVTGDYGRLGNAGELYITGRKKNLIILPNGKNIFPEELEYFFTSGVEAIRDAVVFESTRGSADDESAVLVLAVTLHDGADAQSLEMIREAIERRNRELPGYKQVQDIQFSFAPFARTSTKKIIRKKVKEQYESKI